MTRHQAPEFGTLPLRDRMPDYLAIFGAGLVVAAVAGGVIAAFSSYGFASSFGYTLIFIAVMMLLGGGVSGGGYANLGAGALGTMFGSDLRNPEGSAEDDDPEELRRQVFGKRRNPHERLRKGLRPEANPRAFWSVVGGLLYFAIGTIVVLNFG